MAVPAPRAQLRLGDVTITYLPDGDGALTATALFPGTSAEQWAPYAPYLNADGGLITTLGGYFIEAGNRRLIVDTGFGPVSADFPGFGPMRGGDYLANLSNAGIDPSTVTDVLFTHLHLDHCGWTSVADGDGFRLLFPQAQHWVHQREWEFWYGGDNGFGPHPVAVQQALAHRIAFFAEGDEPAPGLHVLETPGHTPGHCSFVVTSGAAPAERLLITGDTFTSHAQVTEPTWTIAFDLDPAAAVAARLRILQAAAAPGTLAAVNHFSQQVFGRFERTADGFAWTALAG